MEVNMQVELLKTQVTQARREILSLRQENQRLWQKLNKQTQDSDDLRTIRRALGIKT